MPIPSVDPIPGVPTEFRLVVPDDAHEASYFAASARIANLSMRVREAMPDPEEQKVNMIYNLFRWIFNI